MRSGGAGSHLVYMVCKRIVGGNPHGRCSEIFSESLLEVWLTFVASVTRASNPSGRSQLASSSF